jgi:hypothetical protein
MVYGYSLLGCHKFGQVGGYVVSGDKQKISQKCKAASD